MTELPTELPTVRRATSADAPTLADFNSRMAAETEGKALDPDTVRRGVEAVFADGQKGFYLVAVRDAEIVGQLMVTKEWSDWRDGWFWWIQSVYVREDVRGRGIFRTLFTALEAEAERAGDAVGLRLYVERDNLRAQAVYARLGMDGDAYEVREKMLTPPPVPG